MNAYNWTYDYIDENMTFPRYNMIVKQWVTQPPQYLLVKSFVGFDAKESKQFNQTNKTSDIKENKTNLAESIMINPATAAHREDALINSILKNLTPGNEFVDSLKEVKKNRLKEKFDNKNKKE